MNEDTVLEVSNIKKRFKIYGSPFAILKEWMTFGAKSYHRDFWALKGVSFKISRGEFVGIIGPNGAGKSTLLRIITDVLRSTEGSYKANGRVLSILELTGGTDKDLTGRENVIRTGQLMGFPDGYVQERMERIKEFSELGEFFEQPLRTYSTGMKTRLSFSMFAFMDTDVLILDEVLAVGDIFFKAKCFARLAELIEQKTTILLVTHSMGVIQRYCNRVILLKEGEIAFDGDPLEATRLYLQIRGEQRAETIKSLELDEEGDALDQLQASFSRHREIDRPDSWPPVDVFKHSSFPGLVGKARVALLRLAILNDRGEIASTFGQGDRLHLYCEFQMKQDIDTPLINVEVRDGLNLLIHSKSSIQNHAVAPESVPAGEVIRYRHIISLNIAPGNYVFNIDCKTLPKNELTGIQKLGHLEAGDTNRLWRLDRAFAIAILPRHGEDLEVLHGGLCDLPGEGSFQIAKTV